MFMPSGVVAASVAPLTVTATPSSVSGSGANFPITTTTVTATASGGTLPYSYAWEKVSTTQPAANTEPVSPTASATGIRANGFAGSSLQETWKVIVTDAAGKTAESEFDCSWTKT